jgi:hypothetical protein
MNERNKITAGHLSRQAIVYLRQSSAAQVEHNRESTDRQYALTAKAHPDAGTKRIRIRCISKRRTEPGSTRQFVSKATRPGSRVAFWRLASD